MSEPIYKNLKSYQQAVVVCDLTNENSGIIWEGQNKRAFRIQKEQMQKEEKLNKKPI
jgi:hypothetical protein